MNLELNMKGEIILMRAKNYKTNGKALIMAFKLILGGGGTFGAGDSKCYNSQSQTHK